MNSESSGFVKPLGINVQDDFIILSEMPTNNYNSVYQAKRRGRLFVLKGLKEAYRHMPLYIALLQKEYDLMLALDHPGIVRLYGLEEVPTLGPCIVMEYIDGVTLDRWLEPTCNDTMPSAKARRYIAFQLLQTMEYYHAIGIVHRDLKPRNIIVTNDGHVKIIDFGLGDSRSYADFKEPAGTNGYAAPEQWQQGAPVDQRADLYSFGVILQQLFPKRYKRIAIRCTAEDPERRYPSATAVRHALRRRQLLSWLLPLLFAVALLLAVIGLVGTHRQAPPEEVLQAAQTYQLRAKLIDKQATDAFTTDSIHCVEEAQQMLSIYTVRYLCAIYEVMSHYPNWSVAERDSFEAEAAAIMEPFVNRIGEQIDQLHLTPDPTFYQSNRYHQLADRYSAINDKRRALAHTFDNRTPLLI